MSWEDSKHKRIVIDNGGYQIKMSTAAEKHPILVLNAVGQLKSKIKQKQLIGNKIYDEMEKGGIVLLEHPIVRGLLHDSDMQITLWREGFAKLKKFDAS